MAYCRWTEDSELYLYPSVSPSYTKSIVCQCCPMMPKGPDGEATNFVAEGNDRARKMLRHLEEHRTMGHRFPERVIERLTRELKPQGS